eukprot:jgi/Hompol1/1287/HPOL_001121-RA
MCSSDNNDASDDAVAVTLTLHDAAPPEPTLLQPPPLDLWDRFQLLPWELRQMVKSFAGPFSLLLLGDLPQPLSKVQTTLFVADCFRLDVAAAVRHLPPAYTVSWEAVLIHSEALKSTALSHFNFDPNALAFLNSPATNHASMANMIWSLASEEANKNILPAISHAIDALVAADELVESAIVSTLCLCAASAGNMAAFKRLCPLVTSSRTAKNPDATATANMVFQLLSQGKVAMAEWLLSAQTDVVLAAVAQTSDEPVSQLQAAMHVRQLIGEARCVDLLKDAVNSHKPHIVAFLTNYCGMQAEQESDDTSTK